jgi:hypothetical protein
VKIVRPDGFEPPTTWFEEAYSEWIESQQNQLLTNFRLCYGFCTYKLISLNTAGYRAFCVPQTKAPSAPESDVGYNVGLNPHSDPQS